MARRVDDNGMMDMDGINSHRRGITGPASTSLWVSGGGRADGDASSWRKEELGISGQPTYSTGSGGTHPAATPLVPLSQPPQPPQAPKEKQKHVPLSTLASDALAEHLFRVRVWLLCFDLLVDGPFVVMGVVLVLTLWRADITVRGFWQLLKKEEEEREEEGLNAAPNPTSNRTQAQQQSPQSPQQQQRIKWRDGHRTHRDRETAACWAGRMFVGGQFLCLFRDMVRVV
jgi:hypothetical protein